MSRSPRTPDAVLDAPFTASTALLLAHMECQAAVKDLYDATVQPGDADRGDGIPGPEEFDALVARVVETRARVLDLARRAAGEASTRHPLTARQLEIMRLVADGVSTTEIARSLYLSRATVRNHVAAALRALGAHSRLEAIAVARRAGLL